MNTKVLSIAALFSSLYFPLNALAHTPSNALNAHPSKVPACEGSAHRPLSELLAPKKSMCKEACWAQSASDRDLKSKYGVAKIPKRFRFADRFYKQGEQSYMACMRPHGSMAVLNQSISAQCSERANQVCAQACEAALSQ